MPDVRFHAFGKLASNLPENVTMHGWLDDPGKILGKARVLLNTSITEGSPNVVLQALTYGARVVGFNNAGMAEVQSRYPRNVDLCPFGDAVGASELLRGALSKGFDSTQVPPTMEEVSDLWRIVLRLDGDR